MAKLRSDKQEVARLRAYQAEETAKWVPRKQEEHSEFTRKRSISEAERETGSHFRRVWTFS